MKRLIAWGIWLYPHRWRQRYAREFVALIEDSRPRANDLWDVIKGAMLMQLTVGSVPKIIAGFTLAGLVAAGAWTLSQPHRYVSTSVLKLNADEAPLQRMQRLQRAQQEALSRTSLAYIIQRDDLYRDARREEPLENIIQDMRNHDIIVRPHGANVEVSFAASDPATAQKATRSIVGALNHSEPALEVLDAAAGAKQEPRDGYILLRGALVGFGLGLLCAAVWAIMRRRQPWTIKRVSAFAAAGALAGGIIALLMPNQYISSAILRTADDTSLQSAIRHVTESDTLNRIAREYSLYPGDPNPAARMRDDLMIRQLRPVGGGFRLTAITVAFRHTDRNKAEAATRALVSQLTTHTDVGFEILDPASHPRVPSSPNRPQILAIGLIGGLLLGLVSTRFHRTAAAAA